jgi:hypothetical protein
LTLHHKEDVGNLTTGAELKEWHSPEPLQFMPRLQTEVAAQRGRARIVKVARIIVKGC